MALVVRASQGDRPQVAPWGIGSEKDGNEERGSGKDKGGRERTSNGWAEGRIRTG